MVNPVRINSVSELHRVLGLPKPKHPLISIVDLSALNDRVKTAEVKTVELGFYSISLKKIVGELRYGRGCYDFEEGSLVFIAPNQRISYRNDIFIEEGWALYVHPDLLYGTTLGGKMRDFSFFSYDVDEALHISEDEKKAINGCLSIIEQECAQHLDVHTSSVIISSLELLLTYCNRFYSRQFYTRQRVSSDVVQRFELLLENFFSRQSSGSAGLPDVGYFAGKLGYSPSYLSDLLKRYTGKTTQEHIHLYIVEKAKELLRGTEQNVSSIAYLLGFEHPSHFNKIFKSGTGLSPKNYRESKGKA